METEQHHLFETKCARTWLCHGEMRFLHEFLADSTSSFFYTHTSIILYMICVLDMGDEVGCQCNRGRLGLAGSGALLCVLGGRCHGEVGSRDSACRSHIEDNSRLHIEIM